MIEIHYIREHLKALYYSTDEFGKERIEEIRKLLDELSKKLDKAD
jgi:hypothetical protein